MTDIRRRRGLSRAVTVVISAAALCAAGLGVAGTANAGASPSPVDPRLHIDSQDAPDGIASDQVEGESTVSYTHKIVNRYEHPWSDFTLFIDLAPTTGEKASVNFTEASFGDVACDVSATHVECPIDTVDGEGSADVTVGLAVDSDVWESQPLSALSSGIKEDGVTVDDDTAYIHAYNADKPDLERIDFILPEPISNDMDEPGMPLRFVLNNNIGAMDKVRLEIRTEGLLDKPSGVEIGAGSNACTKDDPNLTVCEWNELGFTEGASTEAGIWVADGFDEEWYNVVDVRALWIDANGAEHAFAQRTEYAIVDRGTSA